MSKNILAELYEVLQQRKASSPEDSYVSSLYSKGVRKMAEKIEEEAKELIEEGYNLEKSSENQDVRLRFANEAADLLFHTFVLMSFFNIPPQSALDILEKRFGTGGHTEKARRPQKK
ncbi:MAG: phosphoribosyl-ATP diphosphatase [Alphaproteobacteria bacterium]|nr:phosphoribosyl-ATP diphosphatase [Alphaproteobacteria bacterium]MBP7758706.1 phosphoribosyl-ATP diphosphatase [Alphaproteobacteria bacterium]MBP7761734.1 phosphoribosyl-ATP diphosphatase [Alphaproteobacteria bacterium]MBP7903931.1 phosphoribosyl-ATP diphosphatase [Alphaproteobacteria bacterium]